MSGAQQNVDPATIAGFGAEWTAFDQHGLSDDELSRAFEAYFRIFPWGRIRDDAVGFDAGCGSGRWARLVAPRVGCLHCVDASADALAVARRNLSEHGNCRFHHASIANMPFAPGSMDFGYSLGVLHHVPDTEAALRSCTETLRPGAPFLLYVYYALDGRPRWYRLLWQISNVFRRVISRLPHPLKLLISTIVSALIYWPLARAARLLERFGQPADGIPLGFYRNRSFYTMRTDAYDRLGTRLEQRFTAGQVRAMMEAAGLSDVQFSGEPPFWCAVGIRT